MPDPDIRLFALNSARDFGERVAGCLGVALSPHEEREFEDGEHKARPLVNVRGKDVFVIQPLHGDAQRSVDEKLLRLLLFIGGLVDASAQRVTAVLPYLCYARKEQKTQPRDPVTTRYIASLFEAVGTDRIVALDVHNLAGYQNAFRCRTEHLEATPLFVAHFAARLAGGPVAVVSPDAGGVKRAERFRVALGRALGQEPSFAFLEKHRGGGVLRGGAIVGDVGGKAAIIIDDLISTGSTMRYAATACLEHGATAVHAAASHGVFSAGAEAVLSDPALARVVVTNSVPPFRLSEELVRSKLVVLDVAPLFAQAIAAIHRGGSICALLEG
jgi:ribose-phosphate pyrophosphokinase